MKDPQYIAEQLSQLRDLLIVIERGGDKSPDVLYKLAIEKSQQITQLVEQWRQESNPPGVEIPLEYDLWVEGKTEEEAKELTEPTAEEASVELSAIEDSVSIPAIENEAEQAVREEETHLPSEDEEDDEYVAPFVEDTPIISLPSVQVEDAVADPIPQDEVVEDEAELVLEPQPEPEKSIEIVDFEENTESQAELYTDDTIDDLFMDDATEMEDADVDMYGFVEDDDSDEQEPDDDAGEDDFEEQDYYNRGEPFETEPATTLGDMISVHRAKELRKALSLNDRFRFRRELFGNSDINMNDTLNLIDTMKDLAEAREYLLQDLGWSADDIVVQEFLTLVERHFKS